MSIVISVPVAVATPVIKTVEDECTRLLEGCEKCGWKDPRGLTRMSSGRRICSACYGESQRDSSID